MPRTFSFFSLFVLLLTVACTPAQQSPAEILYVGTYTVRGSEGIYAFQFDRKTFTFSPLDTAQTPDSPSFLAISPNHQFLYSANRADLDTNSTFGSVSAFTIDPTSGTLDPINTVPSFGESPCHISLRSDGQQAYISHYAGGSLAVLAIRESGAIGNLIDTLSHTGSSINPNRQQAPHVHTTQQIPGTEQFLVADLGIDQLKIYGLQNDTITELSHIETTAGAGPRHFVFSPDAKFLYLAEELSNTVSVYQLDSATSVQRLSTLPDDFAESNTVADIHLSPDGLFLYVSNRGHESLAIFSINKTTGQLTPLGHQKTGGQKPRNFYVDTKGAFILVAHQDSDNITVFERDKATGLLKKLDVELQVPSPVCLKMVALRN